MPAEEADALRDELRDSTSWIQGKVWRYEKYVPEPRLGAMQFGAKRHPALIEAQDWIQRRYKVLFDSLALAWYRNERDSVGWHRDRELKWLEDTVIGVLTLGQQRPFIVKRNSGRGQRDNSDDSMAGAIDLSPASGDLLVMGGRCQTDWLHAVPKSDRAMRDPSRAVAVDVQARASGHGAVVLRPPRVHEALTATTRARMAASRSVAPNRVVSAAVARSIAIGTTSGSRATISLYIGVPWQ